MLLLFKFRKERNVVKFWNDEDCQSCLKVASHDRTTYEKNILRHFFRIEVSRMTRLIQKREDNIAHWLDAFEVAKKQFSVEV